MNMLRLLAVAAGILLSVPLIWAGPSSEVAFDVATVRLLRAADPARGEALARAGKCARCHGETGVSDDPADVNIAGQRASYLYKQLRDYREQYRDDRDMYRRTRDLDDSQLADLAAWFAAQEPAPRATGEDVDPAILELVYRGDRTRLLKACASCHGQDGRGGQFDHPALAGQHREYFIFTMTEFREGDRTNDIYARMRHVAEALTEQEIEGLARYYGAALPAE
jgi:cytochrome c553